MVDTFDLMKNIMDGMHIQLFGGGIGTVLKIYPTSGPLGSKAQITGANFIPLDKVEIYVIPSNGMRIPPLPITVEEDGTFQFIFETLKFLNV